jgi:alkylation response protein AidB-like acyl-CoA dehydrogenase
MSGYQAPLQDMMFTLSRVAGLEEISKLDGYQGADPETVATILDEAGRFFAEVIAPLNRVGDQQGSVLGDDGQVRAPEGFKGAYRKYVEAGWAAAHMPAEWGGGGLPYTVGVVIEEMFKSANLAFSLCALLTHGAVEALRIHGSEELQSAYLERLVTGEWSGTMNLTEPEAGSDLGAVRTRAVSQPDGSYRLYGTKIFITWGDHDLTSNIVHFVLARTPDAPAGTRGISMFLVPKYLAGDDGTPSARNDYRIVSIEHKLGIHASPTCVISFGDAGAGAVGYLVGEESDGMRNMFTMMNAARIGVGMEGLALTERSYQQALAFAHQRVQGRQVGSTGDPVAIVEHPDVRRMLLTMRANTEAMRCLLYYTARQADLATHAESAEAREQAADLLALLTPVVKAWSTDLGVEMTSLGIQIHGGMGYIEETGAAQHLRDARIAPIYEGTNGIQAIDLVLRKLPAGDGQVLAGLIAEMAAILEQMAAHDHLAAFRAELSTAIDGLTLTSSWLGARLAAGDVDSALAGATPYLRQLGTVLGGWLMAVSAVAAESMPGDFDEGFLDDKVNTARFFGETLLPDARGLVPAVMAGPSLLSDARL